jgi:hypothetical protein
MRTYDLRTDTRIPTLFETDPPRTLADAFANVKAQGLADLYEYSLDGFWGNVTEGIRRIELGRQTLTYGQVLACYWVARDNELADEQAASTRAWLAAHDQGDEERMAAEDAVERSIRARRGALTAATKISRSRLDKASA